MYLSQRQYSSFDSTIVSTTPSARVQGRTRGENVRTPSRTNDRTDGILIETSQVHNQANIPAKATINQRSRRDAQKINIKSEGGSLEKGVVRSITPNSQKLISDSRISMSEPPKREGKVPKMSPIKPSPLDEKYQNRAEKIFAEVARDVNKKSASPAENESYLPYYRPPSYKEAAGSGSSFGNPINVHGSNGAKGSSEKNNKVENSMHAILDCTESKSFPETFGQRRSSMTTQTIPGEATSRTNKNQLDGSMHDILNCVDSTSCLGGDNGIRRMDILKPTNSKSNHIEPSMHAILDCTDSGTVLDDTLHSTRHISREYTNDLGHSAMSYKYIPSLTVRDEKQWDTASERTSARSIQSSSDFSRDDLIHSARLRHKVERSDHHRDYILEEESQEADINSEVECLSSVSTKMSIDHGDRSESRKAFDGLSEVSTSKRLDRPTSTTNRKEPPNLTLSASESTVDSSNSKESAYTEQTDETQCTTDSDSIDFNALRRFERRYNREHGIESSCVEDLKSSFGIGSCGAISIPDILSNLKAAIGESYEEWRKQRRYRQQPKK